MLWGLIGFLLGAGILGLIIWTRAKNIAIKWYEWLIGGIGLLLLLYSLQNLIGLISEREAPAGLFFLLVIGLPSVIILALALSSVYRRNRKVT